MCGAALLRKTFRYPTANVQLFYADKWYATRKKGLWYLVAACKYWFKLNHWHRFIWENTELIIEECI